MRDKDQKGHSITKIEKGKQLDREAFAIIVISSLNSGTAVTHLMRLIEKASISISDWTFLLETTLVICCIAYLREIKKERKAIKEEIDDYIKNLDEENSAEKGRIR